MSRIREAIRSGWNTSKSVSFSPVEAYITGRPVTLATDSAAPPRAFAEGVGFTGVVLAKLDGDARGGAALSVASVTGRPVMYASTGEKLTDFEVFHPDRMASRILDMGDVLSLIEQAEKAFDADQTAAMAEKLAGGQDFTLDDFLAQIQGLRQMGSMKKMLGMLPGMAQTLDLG